MKVVNQLRTISRHVTTSIGRQVSYITSLKKIKYRNNENSLKNYGLVLYLSQNEQHVVTWYATYIVTGWYRIIKISIL